jgi:hypothetical protein
MNIEDKILARQKKSGPSKVKNEKKQKTISQKIRTFFNLVTLWLNDKPCCIVCNLNVVHQG